MTWTLLADVTGDVAYQPPDEPEVIGKAALRKWAQAYVDAYSFRWEKTSIGFTVSGDWAFERYAYRSTNTDKKRGAISTDEGKDVNIFHHDPDGKWRVAVDSWNSNRAAAPSRPRLLPVASSRAGDHRLVAVHHERCRASEPFDTRGRAHPA